MTGMETMLPGGELLYRSACTYDRAGNRTGREEQYRDAFSGSLHTAVTTYTYDGMGRLTGEELDGKLTGYSYDMTGNRLSRTTEGRTERYHYNSRNQLTELDSAAETVQQEYDHAGNLTAESHIPQGGSITKRIEYTYDAYDRNTSVCSAGCVQQNHYDAEGLRNAVTENGSTTNFVYRNGMLSSELDADRNPVRGYVYGNEYISQNNGSSSGYYLNDEQGSIRYLTGSDGSIRNHYRYSAFGESITAEETVPNRLKYNAQMADELTGLYYLRARYYNASLGRFTQEDVIYNDGLNLYAYCNSNPVMYSDPSGFAKETCKSKVGGECDSGSGSNTTATERRNSPGVVEGNGRNTSKMMYGTDKNAGVIPKEIADKLREKQYNNFDEFRNDFWKAVAETDYANEFLINGDPKNYYRMKNGGAPLVVSNQAINGSFTYQLHHIIPINQGGSVYSVDNLVVVTPRYHAEILIPEVHGYNGFKQFFR